MKISVIVPVFNEKETIEEVLRRIKNVKLKKEIIVIDDYSTDGTRQLLKRINDKEIKVLFHSKSIKGTCESHRGARNLQYPLPQRRGKRLPGKMASWPCGP